MPGTNQYLPFATGNGANALSYASWAAQATVISQGFQPGIALSEQVNTVLRQTTVAAAGVAKFSTDYGPNNCLDDGNPGNFAAALKAAIDAIIATNQGWQPGDIKETLDPGEQAGWVAAVGQIVPRTGIYARVFARYGETYGAGDGSTNFQLPDLRGLFLRGWDLGRGLDPFRTLGSFQNDEIKAHTHEIPTSGEDQSAPGYVADASAPVINAASTEATGGTETRPKNIAVRLLIKL